MSVAQSTWNGVIVIKFGEYTLDALVLYCKDFFSACFVVVWRAGERDWIIMHAFLFKKHEQSEGQYILQPLSH